MREGFLSHGPARDGNLLVEGGRVALWWLEVGAVAPNDWPVLARLLSEAERERCARFHFERDRQVYTLAHALCRGLLSWCAGGAPLAYDFALRDKGKPEVICAPGAPRLRVNLSHTRGMAAVALTVDHDVGVDVEWLGRDVGAAAVAQSYFSARECAVLDAVPEAARVETFLAFWTLKEAYVKAIGKGLSQPLQAFSFDLESCTVAFDTTLADDPAMWRFVQVRPGAEHVLALAVRAERPGGLELAGQAAPLEWLRGLAP